MSRDVTKLVRAAELKNMLGYVSNNNRLEILSALLRYTFLSFTELQGATGMKSSPLNFHLTTLVDGEIVARGKQDDKDGYYLTSWGTSLLDYVDIIAAKMQKDQKAPRVAKNWAAVVRGKLKLPERRRKARATTIAQMAG